MIPTKLDLAVMELAPKDRAAVNSVHYCAMRRWCNRACDGQ